MTIQSLLICIQSILGTPTVDGTHFPSTKLMNEYSLELNPTVSQVWLSDEARAIATGNSIQTQSDKVAREWTRLFAMNNT